MGQTASSQQPERGDFQRRDARRFSRRLRESRLLRYIGSLPEDSLSPPSSPGQDQLGENQTQTQPFATFSRQISAQSIPVQGSQANSRNGYPQDQIFYEQQEERPLVHMEELGMRNAPITHITASPMPRRLSAISRISSRVLNRQSMNNDTDGNQETSSEDGTHQRTFSDRMPLSLADDGISYTNRRLSRLSSLTRRSSTTSYSRRRRELARISRPFPLVLDGPVTESNIPSLTSPEVAAAGVSASNQVNSGIRPPYVPVRGSRLSRLRNILTIPFENILAISPRNRNYQRVPQRPVRGPFPDDPDYFLPPLAVNDASRQSPLSLPLHPNQEQTISLADPGRPLARAETAAWPERSTDRGVGGRRDTRRLPNMLRGRSSRLIRRQDEGPLPRILHLAAVAIAAQLSGNPDQAITNLQTVGADGLDDSLNSLFRTLQEATNTRNELPAPDRGNDSTGALSVLPPLNFLRVFRFINGDQDSETAHSTESSERPAASGGRPENTPSVSESAPNGTDGRTVTLVVVGVRSVPSGHVGHEEIGPAGPNFDAMLNLPFEQAGTSNLLRTGRAGSFLRHSDGRSRLPGRRRASMGRMDPFPAHYDRQRHQPFNSNSQASSTLGSDAALGAPLALSDLPPGPYPPPSTPADSTSPTHTSRTATPSRRPSSASALQHPHTPVREAALDRLDLSHTPFQDDATLHTVQQRRRSDSEFARHRDLGAGAARRNGVVELDDVEAEDAPPPGSRSWLIYVVGTNLSENHPALTTPSLFTDVSIQACLPIKQGQSRLLTQY